MIELVGQLGAWMFWGALALAVYSYLLYPLAVAALGRRIGRAHQTGPDLPTVSLLIPAHNEAKVIAAKLENSLALDYPPGKLQILVVSDGSEDGTDEIVRSFRRGVELLRVPQRQGKPNALNQALPHAWGDILLLCDANTMLAADSLRRLVRHFADPRVGAVTGDVRLTSDQVSYGQGEGLFWKLERLTQLGESRLGSVIGVDGGMYALRRELYVPNRPDTLIDDFVIAMNVARMGKRVLYDPTALATEDAVVDPLQDYRRRVRTIAGGFQTLFQGRGRPHWNQPMLWLGYVSHKVLRWLGPLLLAAMALGNLAALAAGLDPWLYGTALAVQGALYALAFAGHARRRANLPRLFCVPYYFCLSNLAALGGLIRFLRGTQSVTWAQADRTLPLEQRT